MEDKKKDPKLNVQPNPEAPKGRQPVTLDELAPVSGGGEWDDVPKSNENPYDDPINP